jgi:hypothetical protein
LRKPKRKQERNRGLMQKDNNRLSKKKAEEEAGKKAWADTER